MPPRRPTIKPPARQPPNTPEGEWRRAEAACRLPPPSATAVPHAQTPQAARRDRWSGGIFPHYPGLAEGRGVKAGVVRELREKTKVAHTAQNLTPRCFHPGPPWLAACAAAVALHASRAGHPLPSYGRVATDLPRECERD
jgi:hypothetical protein